MIENDGSQFIHTPVGFLYKEGGIAGQRKIIRLTFHPENAASRRVISTPLPKAVIVYSLLSPFPLQSGSAGKSV